MTVTSITSHPRFHPTLEAQASIIEMQRRLAAELAITREFMIATARPRRAVAMISGKPRAVHIERASRYSDGYFVCFVAMVICDGDWAPRPRFMRSVYVRRENVLYQR